MTAKEAIEAALKNETAIEGLQYAMSGDWLRAIALLLDERLPANRALTEFEREEYVALLSQLSEVRLKLSRILVKIEAVKNIGWSGSTDLDARLTALFDELPEEKP